jgi:hypothetical protein
VARPHAAAPRRISLTQPTRPIQDPGAAAIRLQVRAALVFNALGAIAAAMYLLGGGTSWVAWVILVAAGGFSVAAAWWLAVTPERAA